MAGESLELGSSAMSKERVPAVAGGAELFPAAFDGASQASPVLPLTLCLAVPKKRRRLRKDLTWLKAEIK